MIIGICGHKFSGKSTVARLLAKVTGYEIKSFADKLKDITCVLSGCTREQLEDYDFKETQLVPDYLRPYCGNAEKPTFRAFLQRFGSDVMRNINNNIWIDCTLAECKENAIISDVRFPNEADAIKEHGGIIIKIVRDDVATRDSHQSEIHIDEIKADYTIHNCQGLEELIHNVTYLAQFWKEVGRI